MRVLLIFMTFLLIAKLFFICYTGSVNYKKKRRTYHDSETRISAPSICAPNMAKP